MKYLIVIVSIFLLSCDMENPSKNLPLQVAERYGVDAFEQLNNINFTFNVKKGEKQVLRDWKWYPKSDLVIKYTENDTIEYKRSNISESNKKNDGQFINDSYWLLFPLHLKWDKGGYDYTVEKNVRTPITDTLTTKLVIKYKSDQGYTPGDIYELFLDDNLKIVEWVYRPNGSKNGKGVVWEEEKDFKGVKIPLKHRNKEGSFKLWFENVAVN